jgi:hypothetical protein
VFVLHSNRLLTLLEFTVVIQRHLVAELWHFHTKVWGSPVNSHCYVSFSER